MKRFTNIAMSAALVLGAFALPAYAESGYSLYVNLWDAGDAMDIYTDHKITDGAPRYTDTMGIMVSSSTIPAGEVTFYVNNSSADTLHEMVVAVLPDLSTELPYDANIARVIEDVEGANLGEAADIEPGESGQLTLHLKPGTYALYCNIAGHYASGMWTILTVE